MNYQSIHINQYNIVSPLGFDTETNFLALKNNISAVKFHPKIGSIKDVYASIIDKNQLENQFSKIESSKDFSKVEKMSILALQPIIKQIKPSENSLFILATTKGNISEAKTMSVNELKLSSLAKKIANYFQFKTEPIVISNACVSGSMAIGIARDLLQNNSYEDCFIVAVDEVSEFIVSGFHSFQAMDSKPCKPYDFYRAGVNLGEAAAAMYLSKNKFKNTDFEVIGHSSINDANHISGPSRTGEGLFQSIIRAAKQTELDLNQIDYISAHGTATLYNDEMEATCLERLNINQKPINSYKGYFGHTLGASGLLETILSIESADNHLLIKSLGFETNGTESPINVISENKIQEINTILKTSSGFGGCNTAIILKR
jgi:3-oxoacyl-[acyl-carrier-protein] synthase I